MAHEIVTINPETEEVNIETLNRREDYFITMAISAGHADGAKIYTALLRRERLEHFPRYTVERIDAVKDRGENCAVYHKRIKITDDILSSFADVYNETINPAARFSRDDDWEA